jgi:importin subunit beta-1
MLCLLAYASSCCLRNYTSYIDSYPSVSQEGSRQSEYSTRWLSLDTERKTKIKQDALMTLGSPSQKAGNFASQVVAAIAAVELPQGQWPDLIEILLGFVNNQPNPNLKIATLQTIGFICETIVCLLSLMI